MMRVTQNINRATREGAALTITASEPSDYASEVMDLRPEAMFVFERTNLNEPSANPFVRVATLDDLYTLPFNMAGTKGDLYRATVYSKNYKTLPALLKDFTFLESGIRSYLKDLETLDSVAVGTSSKSYLYPEYEDAVLKGLIADLKASRFSLETLTAEKTIIQTTILPTLRTQVIQYTSLLEIANKLYADSVGHAQFIGEIEALKVQTTDLKSTIQTFNSSASLNKTRNLKAVSRFNNLTALADGLSDTDEDIKAALLSEITSGVSEADPSADADILINDEAAEAAMVTMLPGLNRIERLDIVKFTGTSNLLSVLESIQDFATSVNSAITSKEDRVKEIDLLQNNLRGTIQGYESEILRLRPGMDIARPDTDWNLTVVLN